MGQADLPALAMAALTASLTRLAPLGTYVRRTEAAPGLFVRALRLVWRRTKIGMAYLSSSFRTAAPNSTPFGPLKAQGSPKKGSSLNRRGPLDTIAQGGLDILTAISMSINNSTKGTK